MSLTPRQNVILVLVAASLISAGAYSNAAPLTAAPQPQVTNYQLPTK